MYVLLSYFTYSTRFCTYISQKWDSQVWVSRVGWVPICYNVISSHVSSVSSMLRTWPRTSGRLFKWSVSTRCATVKCVVPLHGREPLATSFGDYSRILWYALATIYCKVCPVCINYLLHRIQRLFWTFSYRLCLELGGKCRTNCTTLLMLSYHYINRK